MFEEISAWIFAGSDILYIRKDKGRNVLPEEKTLECHL